MKKSLLTILGMAGLSTILAQTPSPAWQTLQNTSYTLASASTKFLDVVSSQVVWGVGYSGVGVSANFNDFTRTTDGGNTWTTGYLYADTNTYVVSNMEGIDANTAWVASYLKTPQAQGAIHRTTNGGTTWTNMTASGMYTNSASFCNIVSFVTNSVGITMGDPHSGNANEFEIWRTTDGGTTWSIVAGANIPNPTSGEFGLVNVYEKYGTSNFWFGTNKGRIFRSTDQGQTWNVATLPGTPTASLSVGDVAFSSPLSGIATVFNTSTTPATFEEYVTSDGGATWTKITSIDPNFGRNDVCGVPGTGVFVSAANSTTSTSLSYSKDGGITWIDFGAVAIPYLAVDFSDATSGWAATFQSGPGATGGGIYKFNGPTSIFTAPSTVCLSGPSATIQPVNMTLGNATVTYSWSVSSGASVSSAGATSPVVTFTTNGTYTLTLLSTNSTTTNTSTQIVNVQSCISPSVSFSVPTGTNCNNAALSFTNTSTGSPTPTFSWSTSPAANVTISPSPTASNAAITFSAPGVYSVTLWASNASGTAQVTQTVNVSNCAPVSSFTLPANTCTGTALTMTNNSTGATSYSWSCSPSAGSISSATAMSPTITFVNPATYTVTLKATNVSGSTISTQTITVTACAGIAENNLLSENVHVFPNPAKDFVVVELSSNYTDSYTFTLTNILGKSVMSEKVLAKDKVSINLSNLSKGVYFLSVETKGQKATKKIVIE